MKDSLKWLKGDNVCTFAWFKDTFFFTLETCLYALVCNKQSITPCKRFYHYLTSSKYFKINRSSTFKCKVSGKEISKSHYPNLLRKYNTKKYNSKFLF